MRSQRPVCPRMQLQPTEYDSLGASPVSRRLAVSVAWWMSNLASHKEFLS